MRRNFRLLKDEAFFTRPVLTFDAAGHTLIRGLSANGDARRFLDEHGSPFAIRSTTQENL